MRPVLSSRYLLALSLGLGAHATRAELAALPPAYGFREHVFASPADSGHCGRAANGSATIGKVRFAQTHLLEPSSPLFRLAGSRPALVAVTLAGTGKAPDVRLVVREDGAVVGSACLAGPADIPATSDTASPSFANFYTMTIPASWMKPGLSVSVEAGASRVDYSAAQLRVSSPTELNLLMVDMDVLDYNNGKKDPAMPADFLANFAAAMPATTTRLGRLPARMVLDRMVFAGTADEPILACRADLADRAGCSDYKAIGGMDQLAAVSRFTAALSRATGLHAFGFTYGNSENLQPGGWGGGKNFSGGDYGGIFLHEMGHALGLPHWGEGPFGNQNPSADEFTYPYAGIGNNGGGRGPTWNYEPNTREFLSPLCQDKGNGLYGKERSDAMQRSSWCVEWRKGGAGPWDGFGDFSAASIHEFLHGNTGEHSGTTPYFGQNPAYHMPAQDGFPNLRLDESGKRVLVRGATQPQDRQDYERFDFLSPQEWDVPVYTVYGTYHPRYRNVNILYKPMAYRGTLPKLLDPTDPKVFADLKAGNAGPYGDWFWWEKDLTLRFTYADGTRRVAIYPYDGVSRNWSVAHHPWRWDLLYFAINIPADKALSKVEVFRRPFLVRYANLSDSGNIAYSGSTTTPANFLDGAELMAVRTFTDVQPPTGIVRRAEVASDAESLGGEATVLGVDGRVALTFALAPGQSLDRRARELVRRPGLWVVRLRTSAGTITRGLAVP